jgi:hypothetical protein
MAIAIMVLFGLLFTVALADGWLKVVKKEPKQRSCESGHEKRNVVFRSTLVEATPAPLKVVHFVDGKVQGRLVMHGPYQGVVKRILMLWKEDKHRCIKMDALYAIEIDSIDKVYVTSVDEAKTIAAAVYGKKKAKAIESSKAAVPKVKNEVVEHVSVSAASSEVKAFTVVKTVSPEPKRELVVVDSNKEKVVDNQKHESEADIIKKGFISSWKGVIVDAGMQSHVSTRSGRTEQYETYTLTLNTDTGLERMTGNDLRRAYSQAEVEPGDEVRVIYVKDVILSNGFKKKSFSVQKL